MITGFGFIYWVLAVDYFGKYPGTSGLTYTSWTTKQKGMGQLVCLDRILQGSGNMVLPDDVFETYRPVFTRRNYKFAQKYFVV